MNGLIIYKQYLNKISSSVKGYTLDEISGKEYLDLIPRVVEIEDLSYLDDVFSSIGESISYLGDKSFLQEPLEVTSKLEKMIDFSNMGSFLMEEMIGACRDSIDEEDEVIEELNQFLNDLNSIPSEVLTSADFNSTQNSISQAALLETEKDNIQGLFNSINLIFDVASDVQEEVVKEEKEKAELPHKKEDLEDYDEDKEVDLFDEGTEESSSESTDVEKAVDIEDSDSEKEIDSDDLGDTEEELGYFKDDRLSIDLDKEPEDDFEEDKGVKGFVSFDVEDREDDNPFVSFDVEDREDDNPFGAGGLSDDLEDSDFERKDFSKFIGDDSEDEPSFISKFEKSFEDDRGSKDSDEDIDTFAEDEMSRQLNDDLRGFDEGEDADYVDDWGSMANKVLDDSAKEKTRIEKIEDLRGKYKSKEKLKESEELSPFDDSIAKLLLAIGVNIMSLPSAISKFKEKVSQGSKKLRETMVVEDEEEEAYE